MRRPDGERVVGRGAPIARYFRPLAKHPAALGLFDGAAALEPPAGCDLVLKTDWLIQRCAFFPDVPADAVANKALPVDLAAKGCPPMSGAVLFFCGRSGQEHAAPPDARTCNQTVMSDGIMIGFVDLLCFRPSSVTFVACFLC